MDVQIWLLTLQWPVDWIVHVWIEAGGEIFEPNSRSMVDENGPQGSPDHPGDLGMRERQSMSQTVNL